jgi:hypothetical protein
MTVAVWVSQKSQRVDPRRATDQGDLLAAGEFGQRTQCGLNRPGTAARERHREKVDEGALGLMPDLRRNLVPLRCNNVTREVLGDAGFMQHSCFPVFVARSIAGRRNFATSQLVDPAGNFAV